MSTLASTWRQLRQAEQARLEKHLEELRFEAEMAADVRDDEVALLTRAFNGSPGYLARVLAVAGAEVARKECHLAGEVLPRLLAHGDQPATIAPASAVSVLSYVALMRCLNVPLPASAVDVEARWLRAIAPRPDLLDDSGRRAAALACVAIGEVDLVPQFAGGGPLVPRTTSREVAGPNVYGFTRHLAEVVKGGGGADAVEEPWHAVLRMFPLTVASEGVDWIDLVWAAIALMVQIEKRPITDVGTWLPELIAELD